MSTIKFILPKLRDFYLSLIIEVIILVALFSLVAIRLANGG